RRSGPARPPAGRLRAGGGAGGGSSRVLPPIGADVERFISVPHRLVDRPVRPAEKSDVLQSGLGEVRVRWRRQRGPLRLAEHVLQPLQHQSGTFLPVIVSTTSVSRSTFASALLAIPFHSSRSEETSAYRSRHVATMSRTSP